MTKFSREVVELLLVREANFEVLVRIWYRNLLVLWTAPENVSISTGITRCSYHKLNSREF